MAIRFVCTMVILLGEFYAWLMTATGLHLTQYKPAFAGWIGDAQPFVLAALVHAAITVFYLRLASPVAMTRPEKVALAASVPLILVFVVWSIVMSSYSIMFERRTETSFIEAGNQLQAIAGKLRALDAEMSGDYLGVVTNLHERMEAEVNKPEPGVLAGCGNRCRILRRAWTDLQDFQYLNQPALRDRAPSPDLARELSTLENDFLTVAGRENGFRSASRVFVDLNRLLTAGIRDGGQSDETAGEPGGPQALQYAARLTEIKRQLDDLRSNDRKLTDPKYRGLAELVRELSSAIDDGRTAQILDLLTILLIAMAPDILCLAMAALARSFTRDIEPVPMLPWGRLFWRRLRRDGRDPGAGGGVETLKTLVAEQLRQRVHAGHPGRGTETAPTAGVGPGADGTAPIQGVRPARRPLARETIVR